VVIVPIVTALGSIVLSVRRGTEMASNRTEMCGVLVLVREGTLADTRPLPVPSRGHDRGEVVRLFGPVRLRQEGGVVADPGLIVRPGLLGLVGPR
jgi:hypothetical protein